MISSSIKAQVQEDMKAAMRSQEKDRLATIRLILAAIKQREIDERIELTDEQIISLLDKMIKQRRDSIQHYEAGKRPDLAQKEASEISLIQYYLPKPLSDQEITSLILAAIEKSAASSARDMSKVMQLLKPQMQGRADMGLVSAKVKDHLTA